jgi:hypothetical protein
MKKALKIIGLFAVAVVICFIGSRTKALQEIAPITAAFFILLGIWEIRS